MFSTSFYCIPIFRCNKNAVPVNLFPYLWSLKVIALNFIDNYTNVFPSYFLPGEGGGLGTVIGNIGGGVAVQATKNTFLISTE